MWAVLASLGELLRPLSGGASPSTWAERDAVPQRKDYIIEQQNALNAPSYIAKVWAHYKTFRGAPFPHKMSQSEGICPNQSPNQTPMHPRQCHSCASQRHPDTMHNRNSTDILLLFADLASYHIVSDFNCEIWLLTIPLNLLECLLSLCRVKGNSDEPARSVHIHDI